MVRVSSTPLIRRRTAVTLILVALCAVVLVGVVSATTPVAFETTGTLSGEVTDEVSGDPVENVTVIAASPDDASFETTTTDADGEYDLPLDEGVYAVGFVEEGYEPALELGVTITDGETTELDVELSPQPDEDPAFVFVDDLETGANTDHLWGTLSVADETKTLEEVEIDYSGTGADLSDVGELDLFVLVDGDLIEPVTVSSSADGETVTVDMGPSFFDPPTIEPGETVAVAMINDAVENPPDPDEYEASISLIDDTTFTSGSAPFDIVDATGTIAGDVTDSETGDPVENATVAGVNETTGFVDVGFTDDDGSYELGLPTGSYNVSAFHPAYEPAFETGVEVSDDETTALDFELDVNQPLYVVANADVGPPVEVGDELVVNTTVVNAGGTAGEQDVELFVDSESRDNATGVSLDPGETWTGELVSQTVEADVPTVDVAVETANDTVETTAQVYEPIPDHAVGDVRENDEIGIVDAVKIQQYLAGILEDNRTFNEDLADVQRTGNITIVDAVLIQQYLAGLIDVGTAELDAVDAPDEVALGESLNVSADVTNTGGHGTIQATEYRLAEDEDDLGANATESVAVVDLAPDETEKTTAAIETETLTPGTYALEVITEDDSEVLEVEITLP